MNLANIFYLYETGGKRNQEDYIWPRPGKATVENNVFIVCDGVGGSENGEVASKIIAEFMGSSLAKIDLDLISMKLINMLLNLGKKELVAYAEKHGTSKDMATTFSMIACWENRAFIAWCGDSRIYHVRNDTILNKSSDHSLVNSLVKKGELTEEEASSHPQKHLILKAIKADVTPIEAEGYWIDDVQPGDFLMLCSDGLLENISDQELISLLHQYKTERTPVVKSFQQRCAGKTKDNYSMYLLEIALHKKKNWMFPVAALIILLAAIALGFYQREPPKKESLPYPSSGDTSVYIFPIDPNDSTSTNVIDTQNGKITNPRK